jgi:hypothetical protein
MVLVSQELLIVGIPRSGSTLLAALLDSLDNPLCLSEPRELFIVPEARDRAAYVAKVRQFLADIRRKVVAREPIVDTRNPDGTPTTNYIRRFFGRWPRFRPPSGQVDTSRHDADVLVGIKHNVPFFAVLPELVEAGLPLVAIIRHPIPTILSWHETKIPVSQGYMPSAEAFWPELNRLMPASASPEEGWARIYEAFCARLVACGVEVMKYEDIIADVSALERRVGRKLIRAVDIKPRAAADYSGVARAGKIRQALLAHGRALRDFYPDLDAAA